MITSREKASCRQERRWLWLHVRLPETMRNLVAREGFGGDSPVQLAQEVSIQVWF